MSKLSVVVSLLTKEQDFQALQAADAEAAGRRTAVDVQLVFAKNNARLQIEQLYHFIHLSPDIRPAAIAVQTVAGDGLPRVAQDAANGGIGWVLLNRDAEYIDALRQEHADLCIGIVTTDQVGIGRIQGDQIRALLPHGGIALYIQGPPDTYAAKWRLQGAREALAHGGIELKVLNAEWTEASSERAVRSWLQLSGSRDSRVDLVAAQNDAMAIGARKAIASARPELLSRPFTGCDGLPNGGQRLVRERCLAATVIVPPTAGTAVSLVSAHARSGDPLPPRTVLEPRPFPATLALVSAAR